LPLFIANPNLDPTGMKRIRFSPHAEANLKAREISRDDAEAAVRNPDRREAGAHLDTATVPGIRFPLPTTWGEGFSFS
jgi:hypothetical protein